MSKKLQRKKQLRNSLRRSGAFSNTVTKVVEETKKAWNTQKSLPAKQEKLSLKKWNKQ